MVDDLIELLIVEHGYRRKDVTSKPDHEHENGHDPGDNPWAPYLDNLIDHDQLVRLAMALLASGMNDGAAVNFLRVEVARLQDVDEARKQRRLAEIPGMVTSARAKLDQPRSAAAGAMAKTPHTHIWRSADYDFPCTPTGTEWTDGTGRVYAQIRSASGLSVVPKDEIITAEQAWHPTPDEPAPPPDWEVRHPPRGERRFRASSDEWADPYPLPDSLLPVAPFDFALLPVQVRPWIEDATQRMQCPPDFLAVSTMDGLGSLIGRKVAIRPKAKDDWTVIANMWALLTGRPGVLKSPTMQAAMQPLHNLAAKAERTFKKEMAEHEVMASISELRQKENRKKAAEMLKKDRGADVSSLLEEEQESEPPTLKRFVVNDTSVASLGVLLQQNPNGLLVFRDEIVSLLSNLDREELVSERGFYLTGWNGDSSYTFDRIGRGLHLNIPGVCLSMLGSTQPGRISQYLARAIRGGQGDDGLIQRFGLMVWPDIPSDWTHVDRFPDHNAKITAMRLFERFDALNWRGLGAIRDRAPNGDEEGLPFLRFEDDAYEVFSDWHAALERRLHSGELHLAKYRKLVPGLSLICHLADEGRGFVNAAAVRRAIDWASYLETHAQRAYGSVTAASADTAKAILVKIRSGDLRTEFGSRDVWRPQWSKLTDREAVNAALEMLVDYDWLAQREVKTRGRPATVYEVNPKALRAA